MLKKFTKKEREEIRNNFQTEPLYQMAELACAYFDNQLQAYVPWPEDFFNEAMVIIDNIKENAEEYDTQLQQLWKNTYPRFRDYDKTVPNQQIVLATTIVLAIPAIVLRLSNDITHQDMAKHITLIISNNNDQWLQVFADLGNECNKISIPLRKWINEYMKLDNNQYISDEIDDMFTPPALAKKAEPKQLYFEPTHMTFSLRYPTTIGHIAILYQAMCSMRWIDKNTNPDYFTNLFTGKICQCRILRDKIGSDNIYALFHRLVEQKFIKLPDGYGIDSIVRSHFINKDETYIAKNTGKVSDKALTDIDNFCHCFTIQIATDD